MCDENDVCLQSIMRVVFHERRLQYMEKEQLDVWKLTRPGERIVDIGDAYSRFFTYQIYICQIYSFIRFYRMFVSCDI